jgi:hypothetical protein
MLKPDQHCGVITAMTTSKAKDTTQKIAATAKAATVAIVLYHPDVPEQDNRSFTIIGSGFCVHPEGIVITCRHVIADGFIDPDNRQPHVIFYHPEIPGIKGLYIHIVPVWESISDIRTSEEGEPFDLAVLKVAPPTWVRGGEADGRNFANISMVYAGQILGVCLTHGSCRRRLLDRENPLRH